MAKKKKKPVSLAPVAGCEGKFELGEKKIIDPINPGQLAPVIVNVRESALAHMASRGRLDQAQVAAGERLRKLYEQAAIGQLRGVDLEGASGAGGGSDKIMDAMVRASHELDGALGAAGLQGAPMLLAIVCEGRRVEDVAKAWSQMGGVVSGKRAEGYVTGRLIEAVDALVDHWGMIGKRQAKLKPASYGRGWDRPGSAVMVYDSIVASGPITCTGPAYDNHVGKFGDIIREAKVPIDRGPMTAQVSGNLAGAAPKKGRKR